MSSWSPERQAAVNARYDALRKLGCSRGEAHGIAQLLEYRCICHEYLGGVTEIYSDMALDAKRWSHLYWRACEIPGHEHRVKMRAELDRLDLSVC